MGDLRSKSKWQFTLESPARFGLAAFDNGGLSDDFDMFCYNTQAVDNRDNWVGSFEDYEDDYDFSSDYEDAAVQLIDNLNLED